MKLLATGDWHGKIIEIKEKHDLIIYVGDFAEALHRKYILRAIKEGGPWTRFLSERDLEMLVEKMKRQMEDVMKYLDSLGIPVLSIPGNSDLAFTLDKKFEFEFLDEPIYDEIVRKFDNIIDIHLKSFEFDDFVFVGYGVGHYPEKEEFKEKVLKILERFVKKDRKIIFVSHNCPYGTELDKINIPGHPLYGKHQGSKVVREFIENFQPRYCFCGHFHENSGLEMMIGKTRVINVSQKLYYSELG